MYIDIYARNKEMKIKLGIIGLGSISYFQLKALSIMSDKFELVAACDVDQTKLIELKSKKFNEISLYTSVEDILSIPYIDTVLISTPPESHYGIVKKCIAADKNILLEKPAALSLNDLDEMILLAQRKNVFFHIAYHAAFAVDLMWYLENKKMILKEFQLGKLKKITCLFSDPYMYNGRIADQKRALYGSWIDSGVNALSVCERLVDLSKYKLIDCNEIKESQSPYLTYKATYTYSNGHCNIELNTSWDLGLNKKTTLLSFDNANIMLHHSQQKVLLLAEGKERILFSDSKYERLVRHYLGVFSDYAICRENKSNNICKTKIIHSLLYANENSKWN